MDWSILREAGVGGLVFTLYLFFGIETLPVELEYKFQILLAATPTILIIFLIDSLNDPIMEWIAGQELVEEANEDVRNKVGNDQFYYDYDDVQENIDKLDRRSVQKVVTIVCGFLTLFTLPFFSYFYQGLMGLLYTVPASVIIFYLFIYRQYLSFRTIIRSYAKQYN